MLLFWGIRALYTCRFTRTVVASSHGEETTHPTLGTSIRPPITYAKHAEAGIGEAE